MSPVLSYRGVDVALGGRLVLAQASLAIHPGEVVGLLGRNGSGKTSLMRIGVGLLRPRAGEVWLDGKPISRWSERQRAERVGWLPQERRVGWNLPAVDIAALGSPFAAPDLARERACRGLERVDVAGVAHRGVLDLSAGERGRVLFARLLAAEARVLVADEPTEGLDLAGALLIMRLLREEAARGAAVMVSLHDLTLAARFCDRVAVLADGLVAAIGPPENALTAECVARTFAVGAAWLEGPAGPLLATEPLGSAVVQRRAKGTQGA